MKRTLAVVVVGLGAALATGQVPAPVELNGRPPEFTGIEAWLNGKPLDWKALRGKVVVVHFWTFGCINCIRNYPHYKRWDADLGKKGLVVIGVHTPETAAERRLARVQAKVKANGMTYPVAVDTNGKTWQAWANQLWPAVYLVDRKGVARYRWYGELNHGRVKGEPVMRQKIEDLLAEKE
jgi:thiol-disulfide isomerase/thioredoxin